MHEIQEKHSKPIYCDFGVIINCGEMFSDDGFGNFIAVDSAVAFYSMFSIEFN